VALTPIVQVNLALCTLCSLNETQVQGNQYRRTNHVLNATGEIRGVQGTEIGVSSSKLLSLMLEFQPAQATIPAELDTTAQEQLARTLVY